MTHAHVETAASAVRLVPKSLSKKQGDGQKAVPFIKLEA
jgi:hypothetical protein